MIVSQVSFDISPQPGEGKTTDDSLIRFSSAMSPSIIVIESTVKVRPCIKAEHCIHTRLSTSRSNAVLLFQSPRFSSIQRISRPASVMPSLPLFSLRSFQVAQCLALVEWRRSQDPPLEQ